jgi:molybdate transport system ATP-binding protein
MLEINIKKSLQAFKLEVAFSVDHEILAILGPSGSGKTMTLQCIAGLVQPDEGYIKLNDRVLLDSSRRINLKPRIRKVGFVFQNYALFPHLTVRDNIGYGIRHLSKSDIETKVSQLLDTMHITDLGYRYPRQLSAGQQQRVAMSRAIAPEPEVLLLDEPFSALDSQVKERLEMELIKLQEFYQGIILLVTHNLAEGYKLASKIAVYDAGEILQCDNKGKLIGSPASLTVAKFMGFRNLLTGTIEEIEDSNMRIVVPELGTLRALRHKNSCLTPGLPVTIGIRSEYVQVSEHPGENTVHGSVSEVVDEITATRCFFQAGRNAEYSLEAVLRSEPGNALALGTELDFHFPPEHLVVIQQKK